MDVFNLAAMLTLDSSQYQTGLDEAESQANSFGSSLAGGLKTAAGVGATAVAAVGTAVTVAGGAFVKGTGSLASYGDNIDKMSQKMGMSATAYQEWDAILQHSGTSIDSMARGMTTLSQKAEAGDEAFEKLGITQEELATLNQEELFARTISGLQGMESGTERTVLAQELLGGSAKQLGALLNTSAEDTEAMRQRVHELGGVMSDEAVKSAAAYQDSLQDLRTAVSGVGRGMMDDFLPSMTTVMDGLQEVFAGDSGTGVAMITEGISGIIANLTEAVPQFMEVGGQIMQGLLDAIMENLPAIMSSGTDIIIQLLNGIIENLPTLVSAGLEVILSIATGIGEALPNLIPTIVDVILQIVETLIDNIDKVIDAGIQIITGLIEGIVNALPRLIEKAPEIIEKLVNAIVENLPQIIAAGLQIMQTLAESIINNLPQIITAAVTIMTTIVSTIVQNLPQILQKGIELLGKLAAGIIQAIPQLVAQLPQIFYAITSSIGSMDWASIGSNLINGIKNGIINGGSALINAAVDVGRRALASLKSFLGIASPSKKARDEIGKMFSLGMGIGFEEGLPVDEMVGSVANAFDEIESLTPPEADLGFGDEFEVSTYDTGAKSSKRRGEVVDVTINVYATERQDEREIAREVENQFMLWNNQRESVFA